MHAQSLCAQVARRLGVPKRLVKRQGFQWVRPEKPIGGAKLPAVDCPFCGQQVLVAPGPGAIEADCRGCDTSFEASSGDVYAVAIDQVERPAARHLGHGIC
jgi:hypothetical protein